MDTLAERVVRWKNFTCGTLSLAPLDGEEERKGNSGGNFSR